VNAARQLPILDWQIFGNGLRSRTSPGWFQLDSTTSQTVGFFLTYNENLTVLDGAIAPSSTTSSFIFPEIESEGFTRFHIANPNSEPATVLLELVSGSGAAVGATVSGTIAAKGVLAAFLHELFPDRRAHDSDYVRVTSTRGVVPFEYIGKPDVYVAGINGQDSNAGGTVLYSPQYVIGGGQYRTTLSIVNLDSTAGTVTLEFIGDNGVAIGSRRTRPIAPRGKVYISEQDFFVNPPGDVQGYVKITSSGVRLAGNVVFGDPARGKFASSLPLVFAPAGSFVFSHIASDELYFTGIAVLNTSAAATTTQIEVFDIDGNIIASKIETLSPAQRRSQLLTEYFPSLRGQKRLSGYTKITADRPLAGFALFGTHDLSVLSAIPPQVVP
jgi:hypothetical protein